MIVCKLTLWVICFKCPMLKRTSPLSDRAILICTIQKVCKVHSTKMKASQYLTKLTQQAEIQMSGGLETHHMYLLCINLLYSIWTIVYFGSVTDSVSWVMHCKVKINVHLKCRLNQVHLETVFIHFTFRCHRLRRAYIPGSLSANMAANICNSNYHNLRAGKLTRILRTLLSHCQGKKLGTAPVWDWASVKVLQQAPRLGQGAANKRHMVMYSLWSSECTEAPVLALTRFQHVSRPSFIRQSPALDHEVSRQQFYVEPQVQNLHSHLDLCCFPLL